MDADTNADGAGPQTPDARRIAAEIRNLGKGTDPFAAAVRATRMPMCITDPRLPDNPIVFVNDSFCRLAGYSRAEILGRNCRFLQGPETDPAAVALLRAAVAERRSLAIDILNYRKTGEAFWNRLLIAPVFDEAGRLAYFFASQVDVTIERDRVAVLQSDNASLTVEVAARLANSATARSGCALRPKPRTSACGKSRCPRAHSTPRRR